MALDDRQLGIRLGATDSLQITLRSGFDRFAESYRGLFDLMDGRPAVFAEFGPAVTRGPTIEAFNEAQLLEEITTPESELLAEEQLSSHAVSTGTLDELLKRLDPG